MKKLSLALFFLSFFVITTVVEAQEMPFLTGDITVAPEMQKSFQKGGRLLIYLTKQNDNDPQNRTEITIGVTAENWDPTKPFHFDTRNKVVMNNGLVKLSAHVSEKYDCRVIYKQNFDDGKENVPGNLISEVIPLNIATGKSISLILNKLIPDYEIVNNKFVKSVVIKSTLLTEFSGYPRFLKAAVLLPSGYFDHPSKTYPICYKIPGLNGRYDAVNKMFLDKEFMAQRSSKDAPQIIYVFLDSQGPYGDTYQMDSENNGPCGQALTEELIPEIEKQVRYNPKSKMRFLTGCSTGGWIALGLQIFYPDFFDGTWSYSPDPVDFEHYGLINIYEDENVFYNKFGFLQPGRRTIYGEPKLSMKDWIHDENLKSRTNDYRISGGQFGAYNAVFGPKGKDGLPTLMFDPITGKIDHQVARQWEKYDLKKVLEKNWSILGPKLQGKIWIWTGDMDGLYSNVAIRFLKMYLDKTVNPQSDTKINFTAMAGHCQEWSDEALLLMVAETVSIKNRNNSLGK